MREDRDLDLAITTAPYKEARKKKTDKPKAKVEVSRKNNTSDDQDSDGESKFSSVSCRTVKSQLSVNMMNQNTGKNGSLYGGSELSRQARKPLKSGFLDKPGSQVLFRQKWLHMNQNPRYVTEALAFNQLSFPQFVGGKCRTILRAQSNDHTFLNTAKVGSRRRPLTSP